MPKKGPTSKRVAPEKKEPTMKIAMKIVDPEKLHIKPRSFLDFNDILKQFEGIVKKSDKITKKDRENLLQGISIVKSTLADIKSRRAKPDT